MFDSEFFPTPSHVIDIMCEGLDLLNKNVLEPQAGKGDIVDRINQMGGFPLACEKNDNLRQILKSKCKVLGSDFFEVKSDDVSHIDYIIMNPPFSNADKHILHAWDIAPNGCKIISLCNYETLKNAYSQSRLTIKNLISENGTSQSLGNCFEDSERSTGVEIGLIILNKGDEGYKTEFDGFFMDEEVEGQENGIMQYNFIRDIVNRYVESVKIFDKQLQAGIEMYNLTSSFYSSSLSFEISKDKAPLQRADFKKDLQKNAWKFIFNKMNLTKVVTKGVREDINKFVEQQQNIPFTMRNIYRMLEIIVGTREQTFDKAILEVFDRVTEHHHENRHNVNGWKTNSHFLVGKKFILPWMISPAKEYGYTTNVYTSLRSAYDGIIPDFEKALCFVTGTNYDEIKGVNCTINKNTYGEWYESQFFKYKGYKNGNMHFEFKDLDVWGNFNQRVAKLKGFPLFEAKPQTAYQKRNTGRTNEMRNDYDAPKKPAAEAKVLFSVKTA